MLCNKSLQIYRLKTTPIYFPQLVWVSGPGTRPLCGISQGCNLGVAWAPFTSGFGGPLPSLFTLLMESSSLWLWEWDPQLPDTSPPNRQFTAWLFVFSKPAGNLSCLSLFFQKDLIPLLKSSPDTVVGPPKIISFWLTQSADWRLSFSCKIPFPLLHPIG